MKKTLQKGQITIFLILGVIIILTIVGAFVIATLTTPPFTPDREEEYSAESALRKASECSVFSHGLYRTDLESEALSQFTRTQTNIQHPSIQVEKNANDILFTLLGEQITQTKNGIHKSVILPAKQQVRLLEIEREYDAIKRDNNLNTMEIMNSTIINNEVILIDDMSSVKGGNYWYRR